MDRSSSSSFFNQDIRTLCSKPSMMTLCTKAEIVQQCLSSNDSSGLEWTRSLNQRSITCDRCIRRKTKIGNRAKLVNIESTAPMEIVCIDFLSLEASKGGVENILVITDHFTRYAQAFPTRNQTARKTAMMLFDNFIVHYGFLACIHSDQD